MKERELRSVATCARCARKFGEARSPIFYRVSIEQHLVNIGAVQRKAGLEQFVGSPLLATVMGPDEDMSENLLLGASPITICSDCSLVPISVAELAECATKALSETESRARRDKGCPFCRLLHDWERTNCDRHDGTRCIRIRNAGPITDEERETLGR